MAEEVNDKLQDKGYLTMVDITKQYDLPADFVTSVSLCRLTFTFIESMKLSYIKTNLYLS